MCIVIDVNTLPIVLNGNNKEHKEFRPVLIWIVAGKGKMVYGGTKYLEELGKLKRYTRLLKRLRDAGKIFEVNKDEVDKAYGEIKTKVNVSEFNGPHIIAIISVSGCKLLCSKDSSSFQYIKDNNLYLNRRRHPSIYTRSKHSVLLRDDNIAGCCLPCCRGSRELKQFFMIA